MSSLINIYVVFFLFVPQKHLLTVIFYNAGIYYYFFIIKTQISYPLYLKFNLWTQYRIL